MTTLPEIQQQFNSIDEALKGAINTLDEDNFDVELQGFWQQYSVAKGVLEDKINAWCWVITRLQKDAEYYREQAARFTQMARVTENKISSMKNYLSMTIEEHGHNNALPTKDFPKLKLAKGQKSVVVDNDYIGDIPQEFLKVIAIEIEDRVDKNKVKQFLKDGNTLEWAVLKEGNKSLRGL